MALRGRRSRRRCRGAPLRRHAVGHRQRVRPRLDRRGRAALHRCDVRGTLVADLVGTRRNPGTSCPACPPHFRIVRPSARPGGRRGAGPRPAARAVMGRYLIRRVERGWGWGVTPRRSGTYALPRRQGIQPTGVSRGQVQDSFDGRGSGDCHRHGIRDPGGAVLRRFESGLHRGRQPQDEFQLCRQSIRRSDILPCYCGG